MKKNISRITFIVQQNEILKTSDSFLCCVSGGQDSIVLLFILYHLKKVLSLNLTLIYCNHLWQLQNFYTLSQLFKLVYLLNININISVPNQRIVSEKTGHFWRQKNFVHLANFFTVDKVVMGHTCTDQIETSMWHLLRGTSPTGLVSLKTANWIPIQKYQKKLNPIRTYQKITRKKLFIKKKECVGEKYFIQTQAFRAFRANYADHALKIKLNLIIKRPKFYKLKVFDSSSYKVHNNSFLIKKSNSCYYSYCLLQNNSKNVILNRPLLKLYRTTIANLIKTNRLPIVIDSTNQSKKLTRNKIRLIFFPLVKYYIQDQATLNIKKYINITEIEQNYLDNITWNLFKFYLMDPGKIQKFPNISSGIQRLYIKKILEIYSAKQLKTNYIEQIVEKII